MGKLIVYNFVTLNGYFKGVDGDISWHQHGEEENQFAAENLRAGDATLLFGRVTYEMMAGYWPTPGAKRDQPEVAAGMNNAEKIVFSRTLKKADWNNTRIIKDNLVEEISKLKAVPGKNMTILGSGTITTLFAQHGLIDEYQVMVDPVAIGEGTPILKGLKKQLNLQLTLTRSFKSGIVLHCYRPADNK